MNQPRMLTRRVDAITGEPYLDDGSGSHYRRAVVALAWPQEPLPGCVLALAERRARPPVMGEARHLHLLAEAREQSPAALIDVAARWLWLFKAPRLVTPLDDGRATLIDMENDRRREEHKSPLRLEAPLMWRGRGEGCLPAYLALLQARLEEAKTLFLGPRSTIPAEAAAIDRDRAGTLASMLQWPGVAALAWAVEALDCQPMPDWAARAGGQNGRTHLGVADTTGGY